MARHPAAFFAAESVALDQFTGRLTAFNILDQVFASDLPAMVHRLSAVAIYELNQEAETVFERAELKDPAGAVCGATVPMQVDFAALTTGKPFTHTTIHTLWNTPFRSDGLHTIVLSHGTSAEGPWVEIAMRKLNVLRTPHPLAPPSPRRQDASEPTPSAPR